MKNYRGLTLIELLVTLSLLAVSCFFWGELSQHFFIKNNIDLLEKKLINSIHYSRNRALISGQDVTLNAAQGSGDWSEGMILFVDNQAHHYTSQDKLIYHWQWPRSSQLQLVWRGFNSSNYITFSKLLRHSTANGHFMILKNGLEVRRIVVNRLGRVKVSTVEYHDDK